MCTPDERCRFARISELFVFENFSRTAVDTVSAGDICAVCGIGDIMVSIFNYIVMMFKFVLMLILALSSNTFAGNNSLPLRASSDYFNALCRLGKRLLIKVLGNHYLPLRWKSQQ